MLPDQLIIADIVIYTLALIYGVFRISITQSKFSGVQDFILPENMTFELKGLHRRGWKKAPNLRTVLPSEVIARCGVDLNRHITGYYCGCSMKIFVQ